MLTYHVEVRQLLPHELRIYYQFGAGIARKSFGFAEGNFRTANRKSEDKKVFEGRIQKRGTGNSDSVP